MTIKPEGFSTITPYIIVDDVKEVIRFYQGALDAKLRLVIPKDSEIKNHAELQVGESRFMVGTPQEDSKQQSSLKLGCSPVSFYLYVDDVHLAVNKAKSAGMKVTRPIERMFWGDMMGSLIDPFNIQWAIAQYQPDNLPRKQHQ